MERLTRPRRSAAERAKQLISRGFGVAEVDSRSGEGLQPEEEDRLDDELDILNAIDDDECAENQAADTEEMVVDRNASKSFSSYNDPDVEPILHEFKPIRHVGPHISENIALRDGDCTTALDFFRLYFTPEVVQMLCDNTNTYGWLHVLDRPTYAKPDGSWAEVTPDEMNKFIALIIMMGITRLPDLSRYWSLVPLYDGGWARRFLSRNRFRAMLAFLHVSDPDTEDPSNKLCKLEPLLEHVKTTSGRLLQPEKEIAVDERMVRSKGRSGIRQYMPLKPTRFGFKLWCLCESASGYTLDFNVYTGKREKHGEHGLAYDVVQELMKKYQHQGYHLYFDNYYTSMPLIKELHANGVGACGTTLQNRRGFPPELKDKSWQKKAKRGDMRYIRQDNVLCLQWIDTHPVYMASTIHKGDSFTMVKRNTKDPNGTYHPIMVRKPTAVQDYNCGMCAVDRSDQLIKTYNVLMKCHRWWKTLFFHIIDMVVVNCHILFQKCTRQNPDDPRLKRPAGYSQLAFREELIRQMAGILDDETTPMHISMKKHAHHTAFHTSHIPMLTDARHNCKICYLIDGKENKTKWYCSDPRCNIHLCMTQDRNCMALWHSGAFDDKRDIVLLNCRHK